jgi:nuclear transport factor 2 (NTF2) superfamily protein
VRFAYEWHDESDQWCRSYGNENWEFNDLPIAVGIEPFTGPSADVLTIILD